MKLTTALSSCFFTAATVLAVACSGHTGEQANAGAAAGNPTEIAADEATETEIADTIVPQKTPALPLLPEGEIRLHGTVYDRTTGAGDFSEIDLRNEKNKTHYMLNVHVFEQIRIGKLNAYAFLSGGEVKNISWNDIHKALNNSFVVTKEVKEGGLFSRYKEGEEVRMNFAPGSVTKIYYDKKQDAEYLVFCIPNEIHASGMDKMIAAVRLADCEKVLGRKINMTFEKPENPMINK